MNNQKLSNIICLHIFNEILKYSTDWDFLRKCIVKFSMISKKWNESILPQLYIRVNLKESDRINEIERFYKKFKFKLELCNFLLNEEDFEIFQSESLRDTFVDMKMNFSDQEATLNQTIEKALSFQSKVKNLMLSFNFYPSLESNFGISSDNTDIKVEIKIQVDDNAPFLQKNLFKILENPYVNKLWTGLKQVDYQGYTLAESLDNFTINNTLKVLDLTVYEHIEGNMISRFLNKLVSLESYHLSIYYENFNFNDEIVNVPMENLKDLTIYYSEELDTQNFNFTDIFKHLLSIYPKLEVMGLDFYMYYNNSNGSLSYENIPIEYQFNSLKSLSIPSPFIDQLYNNSFQIGNQLRIIKICDMEPYSCESISNLIKANQNTLEKLVIQGISHHFDLSMIINNILYETTNNNLRVLQIEILDFNLVKKILQSNHPSLVTFKFGCLDCRFSELSKEIINNKSLKTIIIDRFYNETFFDFLLDDLYNIIRYNSTLITLQLPYLFDRRAYSPKNNYFSILQTSYSTGTLCYNFLVYLGSKIFKRDEYDLFKEALSYNTSLVYLSTDLIKDNRIFEEHLVYNNRIKDLF